MLLDLNDMATVSSTLPNALAAPIALRVREPSFEQKFLFARHDLPFVLGYLQHALKPDPGFREGRISSIYYDTPTLDLYHEKRASYYLKSKIRVRWYGAPSIEQDEVKCFLELKFKIGGTREKERFPLTLPSASLLQRNLNVPELNAIPAMLPRLGYSFEGAIAPMLLVQYERQRFVHPATGTRVAVDRDICCPAVNQQFVPGIPPAFLDVCVLEIKGPERQTPEWAKPIRYHVRREAFSKYASCFEYLLQPAGRRE